MNEIKTQNFYVNLKKSMNNQEDNYKDTKTKIKNIKGHRFFSINQFKKKLEDSHLTTKNKPRIISNLMPSSSKNNSLSSFNIKSKSSVKAFDEYKTFKPNITLSELNSLKTYSNFLNINNDNIEQEIKPLIDNYYVNEENPFNNKTEENNFRESKLDFMKKYNFFKQSKPKNVKFELNINQVSRNKENKSLQMKPEFFVVEEYFRNPIYSYDKLNINKFIVDNCTTIIENKRTEAYMDKYNAELEKQGKLSKMNNIRISVSNDKNMILQTEESQSLYKKTADQVNKDFINKIKDKTKYTTIINQLANLPNELFHKDYSRDILLSNIELQGYFLSHQKNRPKGRTQATTILIHNKIYLFGGLSCQGLDDLWRYDIKENHWNVLKPKSLEEFPLARYGHTSVYLKEKNEIYTFGGILNNSCSPYRDFILIYDIDGDKYFLEKCKNRSEVPLRRNHIAEVIGPHMLIHGGIDENNNILSDVYLLEFSPVCSWSKAEFIVGSKPLALAHHSSALVVKSDLRNNNNFNVYKFPEFSQNSYSSRKLKIEGIYIFGGIDSDRKIKNDLKVLRIGKRPLDFVTIKTKGYGPLPRTNATLNFYENLHLLILIGGKDDSLSRYFFNDLHIFDLENFTWTKVQIFDKLPLERAEHSTLIQGNKIFIYGGINMNKYIGSDFYIINLDFWERKRRKPIFKNDKKITLSLEKK